VNYDASCKEESIKEYKNVYDKEIFQKNHIKSRLRSAVNNNPLKILPSSIKEINKIVDLAQEVKIPSTIVNDCNATEYFFKTLGDKEFKPTILHIATHGLALSRLKQKRKYSFWDSPLFESLLFFAGANQAWTEGNIPKDREDGIVNAYDIANMNLSGVKLVVLSACETGLGTIKNGEGVYGLQRSFKMAGAENILSTLWKIDDEKSAEFMITFYSYLFSGKSIRDAFNHTQKEMRKKYPDKPYYWAGFVLI